MQTTRDDSSERASPRVRLRFDDVEQILAVAEALILRDWLRATRTLSAQELAQRFGEYLASDPLEVPFDFNPDEALTLRFVLVDADVDEKPGLATLRIVLRDLQPPPGEFA